MRRTVLHVPSYRGYDIPAVLEEPCSDADGTVIMVHGIFSDKEEDGRYARHAKIHHRHSKRTLRFDWQGHGDHPVSPRDALISGDVDDLQTVIDFCTSRWTGEICFVASSFGASIFLLHQQLNRGDSFSKALLLNPVTDYRHTFHDHVSGGLADEFSTQKWSSVFQEGSFEIAPGRIISRAFAIELLTLRPYLGFDHLQIPTTIIHGSADAIVSCEVTERHSRRSPHTRFEVIPDADHAFIPSGEEEASFDLIDRWIGGRE